jgi:hypothetical protein
MRLTILGVLSVLMMGAVLNSCGSKGGGTAEATLAVTLTPPNGSTQAISPGPFGVAVQITSTMPPKGVTIAITAEVDGTSSPFYTTSGSSSTATNSFSITNTPAQETCVVNVTVTSNTEASNVYTGSYRYSAK